MTNRTLTAAFGCLVLLAAPGTVTAQSVDVASRNDMAGSAGAIAAPARSSADQIRADIWAANAQRKADFARRSAEYKAAKAAYDDQLARSAAEAARVQADYDARQAAYTAEVAVYQAKLDACHAAQGRGCRWPSPPPRRYRN